MNHICLLRASSTYAAYPCISVRIYFEFTLRRYPLSSWTRDTVSSRKETRYLIPRTYLQRKLTLNHLVVSLPSNLSTPEPREIGRVCASPNPCRAISYQSLCNLRRESPGPGSERSPSVLLSAIKAAILWDRKSVNFEGAWVAGSRRAIPRGRYGGKWKVSGEMKHFERSIRGWRLVSAKKVFSFKKHGVFRSFRDSRQLLMMQTTVRP